MFSTQVVPIRRSLDCILPNGARGAITAVRSATLAFGLLLLAGEAAWAVCTPNAANGVTATCSGATIGQNGSNGYGTGGEAGVSVTVDVNASVSGTNLGISLVDVTVTSNAGAGITGGLAGIYAGGFAVVGNSGSVLGGDYGIFSSGTAHVTNSGGITGTAVDGIHANTDATVFNNVGGSITGGTGGIHAQTGFVHVTNFGSITGTLFNAEGIYAE